MLFRIAQLFYNCMVGFFFLIALLVAVSIYIFFIYGYNLPDHRYLRYYEPPALSRFYTADAHLLQEYAIERRLFVPFHLIPQQVKDAFLAAEDRHFYDHMGIDFSGMLRTVFTNTWLGTWQKHPGGASTITQQVAKNFLIGNQVSLERKMKEAILSLRLEYTLPKDRIFELYLNQIYLGAGAYGVAAAALTYFNKGLDELSLDEAAFLAALPKAPSKLTQGKNLERLKQRRDWILDYLIRDKKITPQQGEQAQKKPLTFERYSEKLFKADYFADEARRHLLTIIGKDKLNQGGLTVRTTLEPDIQQKAEAALRQGLILYDRRQGWRGPLDHFPLNCCEEKDDDECSIDKRKERWLPLLRGEYQDKNEISGASIRTVSGVEIWQRSLVLDVGLDKAIIALKDGSLGEIHLKYCEWAKGKGSSSMEDILEVGDLILVSPILVFSPLEFKGQHTKREPPKRQQYSLQQIPDVTGGILVIEPQSGRVLALSGGYDYLLSQFNNVTQGYRQPASCFKPFVYLAALEKGISPDTFLLDAPIHIPLGIGTNKYYSPKNYTKDYIGSAPMRVGLEQSRNTMTIRLAQQVGMASIIEVAQRFGIMDNMPFQLAMVLGAGVTTLWKLTSAYAVLANGGIQKKPYLVDWVQDRYGNVLYENRKMESLKSEEIIELKMDASKNSRIAKEENVTALNKMLVGVIQNGTGRSLKSLGYPIAGKTGTPNAYKDAWFVGFTNNLVVGVFVGYSNAKSLGEGESAARVAVPIAKFFFEEVYKRRQKPSFARMNYSSDDALSKDENFPREVISDEEDGVILYEDLGIEGEVTQLHPQEFDSHGH